MAKVTPENLSYEAFKRWTMTKALRDQATERKANGEVPDTDERIVRHANRLREQVIRSIGSLPHDERKSLPSEVRELAESDPIEDGSEVNERVIGKTRDFLSAEYFERGVYAMRSVARISVERSDGTYYGTGFMVSPDLMLTNQHVLPDDGWAVQALIEFDYQLDRGGKPKPVQRFRLAPERFFTNDKKLDYALVAVNPKRLSGSVPLSDFGYCPLVGTVGKILVKDPVNIVQHPDGRPKEVVIRENHLEALPEGKDLSIYAQYIADTQGGSSGSPVFNDFWEVVALHHAGVARSDSQGRRLTKDDGPWKGALWDRSMGDDAVDWIGNEGIRISAIVKHLLGRELPDEQKKLLKGLLDRASSGEGAPAIPESADKPGSESLPETISIPLSISINLGGGGKAKVLASLETTSAEQNKQPSGNYANRPGYNPAFLGVEVPMPKLDDDARGDLALVSGNADQFEFKYHHFSVLFNEDRGLAYVSAVNFNAEADFDADRGKDKWFYDPRLSNTVQVGERFYKNNDLDRGHLTRRADAGWGASQAEADHANDDTFHWTNCSPQHEVFNQSSLSQPKDLRLWGELENHVTGEARAGFRKLSIFNGPVFGENDRKHRGLRIPGAYWKIIAFNSSDRNRSRLRAIGFVISQADQIADLPEEMAPEVSAGKFELWQYSISRIEALTGLNFHNLRNVDTVGRASLKESGGVGERRITALEQIRL